MTRIARLVTIAPSHYCEKARWALDRAGIPYVEEAHAPLFHFAATLPRRLRTTPILYSTDGSKIADSTDILHHVDRHGRSPAPLFPEAPDARAEVERLEAWFDDALGPAVRRFAYAWLTREPELFRDIVSRGLPPMERAAFRATSGLVRKALIRAFKLQNPERVRARMAREIHAVFDDVSGLLSDGRRYLVGTTFSAADLTFASLAAPTVFPDGYRPGPSPLDSLPAAMRAAVDEFRATPAGQFALRMYADERRTAHGLR